MSELGEVAIRTHKDSSKSPIRAFGVNSRGSNREGEIKQESEDTAFMLTDKEGEGRGNAKVFGIFDGAGGIENGRAAAQAAQRVVMDEIKSNPDLTSPEEVTKLLVDAMHKAHEAAKETGGMTTGSVGYIIENPTTKEKKMIVAHVGDSAIFIVRDGKVKQITENDNLEAVGKGNVLTQGLGHGEINPHIYTIDLQEGDRILTATDGVTDGISKTRIEEILSRNNRPEDALEELVKISQDEYLRNRGRTDDTTAILIDFKSAKDSSLKGGAQSPPDSSQQRKVEDARGRKRLGIIDRAIYAILKNHDVVMDCWGKNKEMWENQEKRARGEAVHNQEPPDKDENIIFDPGTMVKVRRSDGKLQDDWFVSGEEHDGKISVSSPRGEQEKVAPTTIKKDNPQISEVKSLDDLIYAINQLPGDNIKIGSDRELSKEKMIGLINQVMTGTTEPEFITIEHGLRQKVKDLLRLGEVRENVAA